MIDWSALPFERTHLEDYLSALYQGLVQVHDVRPLKDKNNLDDAIKSFGYGSPLLITFAHNGERVQKIVLHTMSHDRFGHNRHSDRARNLLLDYANFNALPQHVPAIDVGALAEDGGLVSLGHTGEFFLITPFVQGQLYAADLKRIAHTGALIAGDEPRAAALAQLQPISKQPRFPVRLRLPSESGYRTFRKESPLPCHFAARECNP
ncbi:MAG: hypothetical protein GYB65_13715 [Chloroflexi bacterium]|nr:hypothetical protein [Chloroflexota bacterium]